MCALSARYRATLLLLMFCLWVGVPAHANISSTGYVYPDPSTTNYGDYLVIGNGGEGTMLVDNGSTWTTYDETTVGFCANGTLDIRSGGQVDSGWDAYLGDWYGSATVTVDGDGSALTNRYHLYVGYYGAGTLDITGGGRVGGDDGYAGNFYAYLGYYSGSTGEVTVEGADSTWTNDYDLNVGYEGTGTLNITDGGLVNVACATWVGRYGGQSSIHFDDGTLTTGELWAPAAKLEGAGVINAYHGLVTDIELEFDQDHGLHQQLTLDSQSNQNITVNLDVDGTGSLGVGYGGQGSLTVADGAEVPSADGYLGYLAGSSGTATVNGAGSTWSPVQLHVAYAGTGALDISDGGQVSSLRAYVGECPGSAGEVNVDGAGSAWTNKWELYVGYEGTGTLNITNGGGVSGVSEQYGADLGCNPGSTGEVNVDGDGSTWTVSYIAVGRSGIGTLNITGGATVSNTSATIGAFEGSNGTTTVDGPGSTWTMSGPEPLDGFLIVGGNGTGTLNISGGGQVSSNFAKIGFGPGATGEVTVDGPGSMWTTGGLWVGDCGTGTLNIAGGGQVSSSGTAIVGYDSESTGTVTVDDAGSTWTHSGDLRVGGFGTGTLNLIDGTLRMHGGDLSTGGGTATFNFAGGRLEGVGTVNLGAPLVQAGGTLAPGNSAGTTTIWGGFTLDAGTLEISIDGLGTPGIDWDLVEVFGAVDLLGGDGLAHGMLDVIVGFAPSLNDEFLILDNDGADAIIGTFASGSTVYASYEDSLYEFAIDYSAGDGNDIALLTEAVGPLGDYNGDGVVDAADYTVWRDTVGLAVTRYSGADGNGDGTVNEADYAVWKTNFGATTGGGAGATGSASTNTAVPEPATVALLVLGCAAVGMLGRRQTRCDARLDNRRA